MKVKQNSFKKVLKLFCFSFIAMCGQFKRDRNKKHMILQIVSVRSEQYGTFN